MQVALNSDDNKGHFTRRPVYIFDQISLTSSWKWEMFQTKVVEKIKTNVLCSVSFFENHAVYEIKWKKYGNPGQATDDNMAHAHFTLGT